jgi:sugar phosphate isomerase/epimerase
MNKSDLLRYKNLLLSKRQELSAGKSLADSIPTAGELRGAPPEVLREIGARCNQIGELAGEMGFTAGLHNHLGAMVQPQEEVDQFMSLTDPKLFRLSPDTAHLHLAGGDVVGTFERYKH